jgi:hypothetical protein
MDPYRIFHGKSYENRWFNRDAIARYIGTLYNPTRRNAHLGCVGLQAFDAAGSRRLGAHEMLVKFDSQSGALEANSDGKEARRK